MRKQVAIMAVVTAMMVLAAGSLSWAGRGECKRDGKGPHGAMGEMYGPGWMGGMGMLNGLDLSDQQQKQIKPLIDNHRKEMEALGGKIRGSRKTLHEAIHGAAFDEQAIRKAHQSLSVDMENLAVLRGKLFSEIRPLLTPEQLAKIQELPDRKGGKKGCPPNCPMMQKPAAN